MAKLTVFNQISLDGYFTDARNDMSWAHRSDPEWNAFASENAKRGGILLFGRVTFQMMKWFWPTAAAHDAMPDVADAMNKLPKVVFSRTLDEPGWSNATVVKTDPTEAVRKMKASAKHDLVIMGSGRIVALLAQADLIDVYQLVVNPIILGAGRALFEGVERRPELKLTDTRQFKNGNVVLWYERD